MKSKYHIIRLILLILSLNQMTNSLASENLTDQDHDLLTASQLVSAVLATNPQLEVAKANWQAAIARIDQQSALDDPMLVYSMAPQTIGSTQTDYGQRIEISQKLPWPGKLQLRSELASHKANAINQDSDSIRLLLSATAKTLFADWYYIHQAIHINQLNQTLLKDFQDIAVSRYSTSSASKQDTLRIDVEIALLEHRAIVLDRERRSIATHINRLLNRLPDAVIASPSVLPAIESLPDLKSLHELALQNRPELKVLTAHFDAAKTQSELALKNSYPDINLKAGYNSLWENRDKQFTVGIAVNLPLYQDKHRAAESEALAQMKQAEWNKVDFVAKITEQVQIAHDRATESMHVYSLYKNRLLPLAEENLEVATVNYQSGKGDFLTLISTEINLMQTQLQTKQALADIHKRVAELETAVGSLEPLSTATLTRAAP
ncbi:MAG: TolC family protein [Methylomarinum sp.]|nr:TolC family protein [Methylomarinum sp.]